MSALERLDEWDDSLYVFLLGKVHGRWVLKRRDRKPRETRVDAWFPWCEKHKTFEGPLKPVTGIAALTWASKRSRKQAS